MTVYEITQQIIDDFSFFEDWTQRYEYLISLGKSLPIIDKQYQTEQYLIPGCQSKVWLYAALKDDGLVHFTADSDAILSKGIIALLVSIFDKQPPEAIIDADISFIEKIQLKEHLSPTRANGLLSMINEIKLYGVACKTKNQHK